MNIVHLIIFFPLLGFLFLTFFKTKVSNNLSIFIGIISVGVSFLLTLCLDVLFLKSSLGFFESSVWTWINCGSIKIDFNFLVDPLGLTMITMVTAIGLLIHIFSYWYMQVDKEIVLFFSFMNLFIASMLLLLLADNLILMYLGWEGVGVCSYLLIGFYNTDKKNGIFARKAFMITRIGDICLMISIFLIYIMFHSFSFNQLNFLLDYHIVAVNESILKWITTLLLVGAISKSAQVPLQTWLADAMVGPTPVSALIHAATMVTAGVYLIVRMLHFFILVPQILMIVGLIGVITLFIASISALVQENIKRILAYSTMSQIGYMFVALSVQAWNAAIIHLITHAIFKALLFLSAGSIIKSCDYEQNIFKMKKSSNTYNIVHLAFLIGGLSLVSFPIISLGFYSKEEILLRTLDSGHIGFFSISLIGVFFTSLYVFRLIFTIFDGNKHIVEKPISYNLFHNAPLVILSILSTCIGIFCIPDLFKFFPQLPVINLRKKFLLEFISSIISIFGIFIAYVIWGIKKYSVSKFFKNNLILKCLSYCSNGWGFNTFYKICFVQPFMKVLSGMSNDPISKILEICFFYFKYFNIMLLRNRLNKLGICILTTVCSISFLIFLALCI